MEAGSSDKKGYAQKWANYVKGWQWRYFVLEEGVLSYYRNETEVASGCRGAIQLSDADITRVSELQLMVCNQDVSFYISLEAEKDLMEWLTAISLAKYSLWNQSAQKESQRGDAGPTVDAGRQPDPELSHPPPPAARTAGYAEVSKTPEVYQVTRARLQQHPQYAATSTGHARTAEYVKSTNALAATSAGTRISSPRTSSEASTQSQSTAQLSEVSEWGDAQDDSVPSDDDEEGGTMAALMRTLPQAQELVTLEKMLFRVQDMRRHFVKDSSQAIRKMQAGQGSQASAEDAKTMQEVDASVRAVLESTDEFLLRASDHFRESCELMTRSAVAVTAVEDQIQHLREHHTTLKRGGRSPSAEATVEHSTPRAGTWTARRPASRASVGTARQGSFTDTEDFFYDAPSTRGDSGAPRLHDAGSNPATPRAVRPFSLEGADDQGSGAQAGTPPPTERGDGPAGASGPVTPRNRAKGHGDVRRGDEDGSPIGDTANTSSASQALEGDLAPGRPSSRERQASSASALTNASAAAAAPPPEIQALMACPDYQFTNGTPAEWCQHMRQRRESSSSADSLDIKLAQIEASGLTPAEETILSSTMRLLSVRQKESLTRRDIYQIIRGYESAKDRTGETAIAARKIAVFRDENNFQCVLQAKLNRDAYFHNVWQEMIYGIDRFGHPLIGIDVSKVDVDGILTFSNTELTKLVCQKLAGYRAYMDWLSSEYEIQRYKVSYLIDMTGAGMSAFVGDKKTTMKKIFDIGGAYFPESVWKIYLINTPFAVRMGWSVVRSMVHPVTQAKIKILGSTSEVLQQLRLDGYTAEMLPRKLNGTNPGLPCIKLLDILRGNQSNE